MSNGGNKVANLGLPWWRALSERAISVAEKGTPRWEVQFVLNVDDAIPAGDYDDFVARALLSSLDSRTKGWENLSSVF